MYAGKATVDATNEVSEMSKSFPIRASTDTAQYNAIHDNCELCLIAYAHEVRTLRRWQMHI